MPSSIDWDFPQHGFSNIHQITGDVGTKVAVLSELSNGKLSVAYPVGSTISQ
jgi:hypothetical protein